MDPIGPTAVQALTIALAAGTLLAIAGALMLELLNRRVRSVQDLSMVTNLPILAVVPTAATASSYAPLRLQGGASRRLALARGAA
jgi:capsular polysaccharide biosynthesis protein